MDHKVIVICFVLYMVLGDNCFAHYISIIENRLCHINVSIWNDINGDRDFNIQWIDQNELQDHKWSGYLCDDYFVLEKLQSIRKLLESYPNINFCPFTAPQHSRRNSETFEQMNFSIKHAETLMNKSISK